MSNNTYLEELSNAVRREDKAGVYRALNRLGLDDLLPPGLGVGKGTLILTPTVYAVGEIVSASPRWLTLKRYCYIGHRGAPGQSMWEEGNQNYHDVGLMDAPGVEMEAYPPEKLVSIPWDVVIEISPYEGKWGHRRGDQKWEV